MHAEVSAVLARAEGGVELTHDEVLETIVGISRARELELQETVTPRKPGLFPEQLASGDAADGAPEALGDPAGPVGEVPADGAEDAAQAPGDDSADEGWRPPRALYESSKKGEKGAAEKTVQ